MTANPFPPRPCPADILAALDSEGEIPMTRSQLRRYAAWSAELMGLSFDEAEALHRNGTLARTALGCEIDFMFRLLEARP